MIRYAITDRQMFHGDEDTRRAALLRQARQLAIHGVDYLQLREKDMPDEHRIALAIALRGAIAAAGGHTKVLLSGTPALARAAGVDGCHLPSSLLHLSPDSPELTGGGKRLFVSASCHTLKEVQLARRAADLILFSPVHEKRVAGELVLQGTGLLDLGQACLAAAPIPVLALGGITETNAPECVRAGAAGYASIRAFL